MKSTTYNAFLGKNLEVKGVIKSTTCETSVNSVEHVASCAHGCNGCDDCTYYYDDASEPDDFVCDICHGDGMDPRCDWLLPCVCQGEQKPAAV